MEKKKEEWCEHHIRNTWSFLSTFFLDVIEDLLHAARLKDGSNENTFGTQTVKEDSRSKLPFLLLHPPLLNESGSGFSSKKSISFHLKEIQNWEGGFVLCPCSELLQQRAMKCQCCKCIK